MTIKRKVFVVIPAYNEGPSVGLVVRKVLKHKQINRCVVINDGSSDDTARKAKGAGAIVLSLKRNSGAGAAIYQGLRFLRKFSPDVVVILDGDGQHDPAYISRLIAVVLTGADYVVASRYVEPSKNVTTVFRKIGTQCISMWIFFWYGAKIFDPTSGYRAFNKKLLQQLCRIYPTRFSEPEIILCLLEQGVVIQEIPCQMKLRSFGKSSISIRKAMQLMLYIFVTIASRGFRWRFNRV